MPHSPTTSAASTPTSAPISTSASAPTSTPTPTPTPTSTSTPIATSTWRSPWNGPADPVTATWGERLRLPLTVVLTIAAWIVLLELDRLLGSVVGEGKLSGQTASLRDVTGISAWSQRDAWLVWSSSDYAAHIPALITAYAIVDIVFIALYARLLLLFTWESVYTVALLTVVVALDVHESVWLVASAVTMKGDADAALPSVLAVVAITKWVAIGLLLVVTLAIRATRSPLRARVLRAGLAVKTHALAVIFVVVLGFLALYPSSSIFEQLPDVQRQWTDSVAGSEAFELAVWPLGMATVALLLTAVVFWYLGRRRSEVAVRDESGLDLQFASLGWWVAIPYGVLWIAVVAAMRELGLAYAIVLGLVGILATAGFAYWTSRCHENWHKLHDAIADTTATEAHQQHAPQKEAPRKQAPPDQEHQTPATPTQADQATSQKARSGNAFRLWLRTYRGSCGVVAAFVGVPVVILIGRSAGRWVHFGPLAVIVAFSAVILALSGLAVLRGWRTHDSAPKKTTGAPPTPGTPGGAEPGAPTTSNPIRTTWLVGDALAMMVLTIAPLGIVRSLTGPVAGTLLGLDAPPPAAVRLYVAALFFVVLTPIATYGVMRWVDRQAAHHSFLSHAIDPRKIEDPTGSHTVWGDIVIAGLGIAIVGGAALAPWWFAAVGPVAATVFILTGWGMILGALMLTLQRTHPVRYLRVLGFRRTPVLTIVFVMGVITAGAFSVPYIYAVRSVDSVSADSLSGPLTSTVPSSAVGVQQNVDARMFEALGARFRAWTTQVHNCPEETPRPLILVAAEGGGARAAYWTVKALETFRASGSDCLDAALFLASGISGGSVGLVVDQLAAEPEKDVKALTGAMPLSVVVTSMFGADQIAGFTGIRIPGDDGVWTDRAAHLESAWQHATADGAEGSPLAEEFDLADRDTPFLMLNSTDAVSGCRISLMQLDVAEYPRSLSAGEGVSVDDCSRADAGGALTLPFDALWPGCDKHLRWSTASLLSARFPFVTPSGWMPVPGSQECAGPTAQLVDGGYAEGSGLAPIDDLMPELAELVVDYNATANRPVVPIVLYLKNERGFELDSSVKSLAAEVMVPVSGFFAAAAQNSERAWLQRIDDSIDSIKVPGVDCTAPAPTGRNERDEVDQARANEHLVMCGRIVVVSATTVPSTIPPLGWTLSQMSTNTMDDAIATAACKDDNTARGYANLHNLLTVYKSAPECPADEPTVLQLW